MDDETNIKTVEEMYKEGFFGNDGMQIIDTNWSQDMTGTGQYIYNSSYTSPTITIDTSTNLDDLVFGSHAEREGSLVGINERLETIEKHLGILKRPDPEMLEKYEALRNAYEEYKLIEKICLSGKDDNGET